MERGEIPFIIHPTTMMKKEIFLAAGAYDLRFPVGQDFELISRIIHYERVIAIPEPLVWYRVHSQSSSMQKFFTQQLLSRWTIARHQARLVGNSLPELNKFITEEKQQSLWSLWIRNIKLFGQFNYRKAGLFIANKQYLNGLFYLTLAILVNPNYSVRRIWQQRLSPEARRQC